MLIIKRLVNHQRHSTKTIEYRIKNLLAEFNGSSQLTASHGIGYFLNTASALEENINPGRIRSAIINHQPAEVVSDDQCLTIADKYVPDRIILFNDAYTH